MDEYKDILDILKPKCEVKASGRLRAEMCSAAIRRNSIRRRVVMGLGACAAIAAVVLLMVLVPNGISAKELLENAISSLDGRRSIEMEIEVRTTPFENFRYINHADKFVVNNMQVVYDGDSVSAWRFDKGGRVACGSEGLSFFWLPKQHLGMVTDDVKGRQLLGYMSMLLEPKEIIKKELEHYLEKSANEYKLERICNNNVLTVKAAPVAEYHDGYLLNSSIYDSSNVRRYEFDSQTGRLVNLSIYIVVDGKEVEVLRVKSISYDTVADPAGLLVRPTDIEFNGMQDSVSGLDAESCREAARMILSSFRSWREDSLKLTMTEPMVRMWRDKFRGSELLGVGEPFKSGSSDCDFVPYELKLRDGRVVRHNLSLKQLPNGRWMLRGGL